MAEKEYIEREALIAKMRAMPIPKQTGSGYTWLDNCAAGVNAAIREVKSFPAADVAPVVHGRWGPMYWDEAEDGFVRDCSACNNPHRELSLYCPNCGARMDGE